MQYKAPIRDMKFVMHELLKFEEHYAGVMFLLVYQ